MHDIGKIAIDDQILRKPGKFTPEEFNIMKQHPEKGAIIVENLLSPIESPEFVQLAKNVAWYHHERFDGSGYPKGLKGAEIPFEARVMAVADVYDALVSKRCYKEKFSFEKAYSIIIEGMGTQFDPALKDCFIACRSKLEEYYSNLNENVA
jgi:HD-GYP domain-containing protein (c-di-GMP phosphodiesterase class II)